MRSIVYGILCATLLPSSLSAADPPSAPSALDVRFVTDEAEAVLTISGQAGVPSHGGAGAPSSSSRRDAGFLVGRVAPGRRRLEPVNRLRAQNMELLWLTGFWGGAVAVRVAFLAFHFRDLDRLWSDFERGGPLYRLARVLDYATLGVFLAGAVWTLWRLDGPDPGQLGEIFAAWLGLALLERLPVHRFPRTNLPGALDQAKLDLAVHLLLSVLGALGVTAVVWIYYWWRG